MKFYFLFLLTLLSFKAQARSVVYGGANIGELTQTETSAGNTFRHSSTFFVGHFGIGAGFRSIFEIGSVELGPVAELGWMGDSIERKQAATTTATYRYEAYRLIAGLHVAQNIGSFKLIAEYYPFAQSTVMYSDEKSDNLFRKNDTLNSTGWALGGAYGSNESSYYTVLYRALTYKDIKSNGAAVTLPSLTHSSIQVGEVVVTRSINF